MAAAFPRFPLGFVSRVLFVLSFYHFDRLYLRLSRLLDVQNHVHTSQGWIEYFFFMEQNTKKGSEC